MTNGETDNDSIPRIDLESSRMWNLVCGGSQVHVSASPSHPTKMRSYAVHTIQKAWDSAPRNALHLTQSSKRIYPSTRKQPSQLIYLRPISKLNAVAAHTDDLSLISKIGSLPFVPGILRHCHMLEALV
jgi:hypothetical protein